MAEEICTKHNGRGWRCTDPVTTADKTSPYCDKHYQQRKNSMRRKLGGVTDNPSFKAQKSRLQRLRSSSKSSTGIDHLTASNMSQDNDTGVASAEPQGRENLQILDNSIDVDLQPSTSGGNGFQADMQIVKEAEMDVPVEYPNAGALFEPRLKDPIIGHLTVGGFSVPAHFAPLYTKIWEKYGHIATTRVIPDCTLALVTTVANILPMIGTMDNKTLDDVTEDMLEQWENLILMCENFKFNVTWLRQRLDSVKADHIAGKVLPSLDAVKQEEDALIQERAKIEKMTQDLKVRTDAFNRITQMLAKRGKLLLDGLF